MDISNNHAHGTALANNPVQALKLSVLMPVHNESRTIEAAVEDVLGMALGHPFELVIVDDGSTDGTSELLGNIDDERVVVQHHPLNLGKGAAVLTASCLASGSHFVIFDADREYRATDLVRMFQPIVDGTAEVVFGVRMFGMNTVYHSYRYAVGNRVTTLVANVLFDACLTDLHSCLKMVPSSLFRSLTLTRANFGLDSEITAELLRRGYRPYEVPVSYVGRSHSEGKKLTWRDGVDCLRVLGSVRLRRNLRSVGTAMLQPEPAVAPLLVAAKPSLTARRAGRGPLHLVTGADGQQQKVEAVTTGPTMRQDEIVTLENAIELRDGDDHRPRPAQTERDGGPTLGSERRASAQGTRW